MGKTLFPLCFVPDWPRAVAEIVRAELADCLRQCPARQLRYTRAIRLPAGKRLAPTVESLLPDAWPWGAFLLVSGEIAES